MILESTIHRISNFDKRDWRHVLWLIRCLLVGIVTLNFKEVTEAYWWIRVHCEYDHSEIKE